MNLGIFIASIATPFILVAATIVAVFELRAIRKERMGEIVLRLIDKWDTEELTEAKNQARSIGTKAITKIFGSEKAEQDPAFFILARVANYFDGLGVLIDDGYLDRKTAYDLLGEAESDYFTLFEEVLGLSAFKDRLHYWPILHEHFIHEKAKRTKRHHPSTY
jgi:hypothetical protein